MTRIFLTIAAVFALSLPLRAQTTTVMPDPGIEAVISQQMEAFKAEDFDRAFSFASPTIQGVFGSSERFRNMVVTGYPMVHHPQEVQFLELRSIGGQVWQKVLVKDAAGVYYALDYQMVQSPEGGWQINGVQLLKAEQLGA
ncbi:DUF4864 domain-containing protein [Oceaniglobus roseus]|uniref:DUF4864 domain-containing protein n=1 Tax=Oceaniglobus roseus TaxID=1737570 RepID=UPI000C7EAF2E|nr:DUF4864 domain-containing protein [Kandeliimicrobium roseum]